MDEHKRKNLQDGFVGDADPLSEGCNTDEGAPESVEFRIKSGTLRAQVPNGTPTNQVLGPDRFYEADLVLEDDTRVTVQVAEGADGVNVTVGARTEPSLSGISAEQPDVVRQPASETT